MDLGIEAAYNPMQPNNGGWMDMERIRMRIYGDYA